MNTWDILNAIKSPAEVDAVSEALDKVRKAPISPADFCRLVVYDAKRPEVLADALAVRKDALETAPIEPPSAPAPSAPAAPAPSEAVG